MRPQKEAMKPIERLKSALPFLLLLLLLVLFHY